MPTFTIATDLSSEEKNGFSNIAAIVASDVNLDENITMSMADFLALARIGVNGRVKITSYKMKLYVEGFILSNGALEIEALKALYGVRSAGGRYGVRREMVPKNLKRNVGIIRLV